jgi:hypothetical protein
MEQLQSNTVTIKAFSYMAKYLRISSYIRNPFLIFDFFYFFISAGFLDTVQLRIIIFVNAR